jgi:hypothetical protein
MADHCYAECHHAELHYAKCHILIIIMLNVFMLIVITAECCYAQYRVSVLEQRQT